MKITFLSCFLCKIFQLMGKNIITNQLRHRIHRRINNVFKANYQQDTYTTDVALERSFLAVKVGL